MGTVLEGGCHAGITSCRTAAHSFPFRAANHFTPVGDVKGIPNTPCTADVVCEVLVCPTAPVAGRGVPPVTEARCCVLGHRAAVVLGSAIRAPHSGGLCQPLTQDLGFAGLPARHWLFPNGVSCTGQQAGCQCPLARCRKSCIPWRTLLQSAGEPWPLAGENNSCLHPADSRASPLATEQPSQEMCVRPEPAGTALGPSWLQVGQHICDTSGCPGCPQPSTVSCSKPA